MITLQFHPQPQFKYELFHIYFTIENNVKTMELFYLLVYIFVAWEPTRQIITDCVKRVLMFLLKKSRDFVVRGSSGRSLFRREAPL